MMDSKRSCFSGLQIVLIKIPICLHGQRSALARQDESASCGSIKNKSVSDQEWAEQLHKPIIRKLE